MTGPLATALPHLDALLLPLERELDATHLPHADPDADADIAGRRLVLRLEQCRILAWMLRAAMLALGGRLADASHLILQMHERVREYPEHTSYLATLKAAFIRKTGAHYLVNAAQALAVQASSSSSSSSLAAVVPLRQSSDMIHAYGGAQPPCNNTRVLDDGTEVMLAHSPLRGATLEDFVQWLSVMIDKQRSDPGFQARVKLRDLYASNAVLVEQRDRVFALREQLLTDETYKTYDKLARRCSGIRKAVDSALASPPPPSAATAANEPPPSSSSSSSSPNAAKQAAKQQKLAAWLEQAQVQLLTLESEMQAAYQACSILQVSWPRELSLSRDCRNWLVLIRASNRVYYVG